MTLVSASTSRAMVGILNPPLFSCALLLLLLLLFLLFLQEGALVRST